MNYKEIRIGNLVQDEQNEIITVNHIEKTGINANFSWGDSSALEYDMDKIKPISLNEGWLIKFGFKKNGNEWMGVICLEENKTELYYSGGEGVKLSEDIKYIHQLQNLVFALTYKELTVSS
ncbi:hypothetical protein [Thalassobellus suaedae]|uniref:Uncharacterized protein n=1 Tax=Thalassobellus suaedae TaxID=3074124 RepID=A0ABY9XW96_9FLAO|nr:hypothetical protein RHP51_04830 [Flavobacteriaceae bacterium HL-DH14]